MTYTPEEIEKMADDALKEIHKHTTLCIDENEEHIFLCGFNAGLHTKVKNLAEPDVIKSVVDLDGKTITVKFKVSKLKPKIYLDD